jgi:hypothetical protein
MDMDRFEEMARDPRFISGIYNYCDAWCERCAFTFRCMNYAMAQEEQSGDSRSRDAENKVFWDKLHETFEAATEMIWEEAEDMDIDFDEEDFDEFLDRQEEVHEAARSQPYSRTAMRYMDVADAWFELNKALFADEGGVLELFARADDPGVGPADDTAALRDCLEVIRWYQRQIYVKLCRAASGTIRGHMEDMEGFQEDADGSAKVALIGIERSIAAWATVLRDFPDHEDAIFAMVTLKRLLRQVEAAFPNARTFRRPGFDTEETQSTD